MSRQAELYCIVLDIGVSMGSEEAALARGDADTRLTNALAAVREIIQQWIMFGGKRDRCSIVVVGSEDTENPLAKEHGGYEHVRVISELGPATLDTLRSLDGVPDIAGRATGDITDGCLVAYDILKESKGTKKIIVLTDGESEIQLPEQLEDIGAEFRDSKIMLDVIGVDVAAGGAGEGAAGGAGGAWADDEAHRRRAASEERLTNLVAKLGGGLIPVQQAMDMIASVKCRGVAQASKFRGDLEVSDALKIGVWAYSKTAEVKLPSLKKVSKPAEEVGDPDGKVILARKYLKEGSNEEVDSTNFAKGYYYGKQLVVFSAEDIASTKFQSLKCLKVIGFTERAIIPREHFMGAVDCIAAQPDNEAAGAALSALIRALHDTHRVAIVRYVKRANGNPILGIMSPRVMDDPKSASGEAASSTTDFECLYLNQLPYFEDFREYTFKTFAEDTRTAPSSSQLAAAENLIKSLNLMHYDGERVVEKLDPLNTFNPVNQRFYNALRTRALAPGAALPPPDPEVEKCMHPDPEVFAKATGAIDRFKSEFPLKRVAKAVKRKRKFWGDDQGADGDADGAAPAKSSRDGSSEAAGAGAGAGGADDSDDDFGGGGDVAALFGGKAKVDSVGTLDPIGDFKALLSRREGEAIVETAVTGMAKAVRGLVQSGQAMLADKAMECLIAFREGCVQNWLGTGFNDALRSMKTDWAPPDSDHHAFWERIKEKGITLITKSDDEECTTTEEEAAEFLTSAPQPAIPAPPVPEISADDDLDLLD